MDFPSYVPNAVRVQISAALEGDEWGRDGWIGVLAKATAELSRMEAELEAVRQHPDRATATRVRVAEQRTHCAQLADNVACFQRLALRPEMQDVYSRLVGALNTDDDLRGFIRAAWGAQMDYGKFRQRLKDADELARNVATAAGALAGLLHKSERLASHLPDEFYSIQALLKATDHEAGAHNHHMWRALRHVVLAELLATAPPSPSITPARIERTFIAPGEAEALDPVDEARNSLLYAWSTAPDMARLLATMERAALECAPAETGSIGAALVSQKRNPKYEYLRAFGTLLRDEHGIALTSSILNAMAVTSTVVLNDDSTIVDYEDVRKAVASLPA
jgi:hypothetical protein